MTAPLQREMLEGERKAEPWKNRLHRGFLAKRREKAVEGIVETWDVNVQQWPSVTARCCCLAGAGQFRTHGGLGALECDCCHGEHGDAAQSPQKGLGVSLKPLQTEVLFQKYLQKVALVVSFPSQPGWFKPTCFSTCSARYKSVKSKPRKEDLMKTGNSNYWKCLESNVVIVFWLF